jgi:hypothetical protein
MKKADNFDAKQWLVENKITTQSKLTEGKIKNQYVVKDEEESDEYGDFYVIDKKKAFEYLKQFNSKEASAKQFIKDDEGWGEFEQYLEDVEKMSDKELEAAMREDMSMYFFSNPDELGQSKLNEEDSDTKNNIIVGWKWKSQQMRRDNVEEALAIIGFGKNQDRMYNSLPREGKMVAFIESSNPNSASERLRKAGKLDEWFEPVYK